MAQEIKKREGVGAAVQPYRDPFAEMRAEMDVVCLIPNCPQLNNPCNGWNPTPVEVLIF